MINSLQTRWHTLSQLGWSNVGLVFAYRLVKRIGLLSGLLPLRSLPLFTQSVAPPAVSPSQVWPQQDWVSPAQQTLVDQAQVLQQGKITYFSCHLQAMGNPPHWFANPWGGQDFPQAQKHWSAISDFSGADIKICWEPSRWEWAPLLVRAWRSSGDSQFWNTWQHWCQDWSHNNPINGGPNWKCGQECSIRLINGLLSTYLAGLEPDPSSPFKDWVLAHCRRIAPTIYYAVAQNNNHGTSEAAGLFIGGLWLSQIGLKAGSRFQRQGRYWLENRVAELVMEDGSFSQNSLMYHRLLLDTLCQVEWWRRQYRELPFSDRFYRRVRRATQWLWNFTDLVAGRSPNLGSNDGSKLFALHSCDYGDLRPTLQLASALFYHERWLPVGPWDEPLAWLNLEVLPGYPPAQVTQLYPQGGYAVLRPLGVPSWALMRLPTYRFRPAHADALHLDLWVHGKNLLRDGGSYSYNTDASTLTYFKGTASHNTIQFDNQDQMAHLGRFLFGDWLQPAEPITWGDHWVQSAYHNPQGHKHRRQVNWQGDCWQIQDDISGWHSQAIVRWRLMPGNWQLRAQTVYGEGITLTIESSVPICRFQLVEGQESSYYLQSHSLPVLEVELASSPAQVITTVRLT